MAKKLRTGIRTNPKGKTIGRGRAGSAKSKPKKSK